MLTGAILLGLIMATAPLVALTGGGADSEPLPEGPAEDSPDRAEHPLETPPEADEPAEDEDGSDEPRAPVDYEFVLQAGEYRIEDFEPGEDTLTLTTDTWSIEVTATSGEEGGPSLRIASNGATAILRFPGLSEPPLAWVYLLVAEPGHDPVRIPLADVMEPDSTDPLQPGSPDAPDTPPGDPSTGPALPPREPDAPDTLPGDPSMGDPLAPTDPDARDP